LTYLATETDNECIMSNILITGGAGSLGNAFTHLLSGEGHTVFVVDSNEWAIAELQSKNLTGVKCYLTDFSDISTFDAVNFTYCIHAAAYKHLPLGEENPHAFIENNVAKTAKLFKELSNFGTKTLFISTDKAVEPQSTYGYTKALGEDLARHHGFSIARLGNILESSGSVIPVWEKQIAKKEPITITSWDMPRYFIDADAAVDNIWSCFIMGQKLITPEMGNPVSLRELLENVLQRHGFSSTEEYEPGFVEIGVRPKEKLVEKLKWDWE